MKKGMYFILTILIISSFILVACSSNGRDEVDTPPVASEDELVLTLDELAKYNGKDGRPAYVAVDGVIYDVTDSAMWGDGEHNGFEAGKDLTEEIKDVSPHGVSVLSRMPVVGTVSE
ncbi:MAG: hypothetical protein GX053_04295 [Tissierella sp.]|nr:hypothetical protein [Tissierella sp.]